MTGERKNRLKILSRTINALLDLWIFLFAWIPTPLGIAARLLAWRWLFHSCGSVRFYENLTFSGLGNIRLGNNVRLGKGCFITATDGFLEIGDNCAISPCAHIGADNGRIIVGKFCAIGPGCVLRSANHCFNDPDTPISHQGHLPGTIIINDDVWLGANCVITPDVTIGAGAVVGAGSVVTHDVEPWSIVGGVPAKVIGWRKKSCLSG